MATCFLQRGGDLLLQDRLRFVVRSLARLRRHTGRDVGGDDRSLLGEIDRALTSWTGEPDHWPVERSQAVSGYAKACGVGTWRSVERLADSRRRLA